jgi:hypothetical protein
MRAVPFVKSICDRVLADYRETQRHPELFEAAAKRLVTVLAGQR